MLENEINIFVRTQMLVIEPNTRSATVIDAGPIGVIDPTDPGTPGQDAKSAYETAVQHGFVGTVQQWLASLEPASLTQTITFIGGINVTEIEEPLEFIGGVPVENL